MLKASYADLVQSDPNLWEPEVAAWDDFDRDAFENLETVGSCLFASWTGDDLVGFGSFDPRPGPEIGIIGHNCILPPFRGRGFGARQIREILRRLESRGIRNATVSTLSSPWFEPARRTYAACGFREGRRHPWERDPSFEIVEYVRRLGLQKILVSACLLGERVRHDGRDKLVRNEILDQWIREGRVVPFCPEVAGDLPVPRPPAEIQGGMDGRAVLAGSARVVNAEGLDVTASFLRGAESAEACARANEIGVAILKERSPSCGSSQVYDGTFTSTRLPGVGVAAARLIDAGIRVFNEEQFVEANGAIDDDGEENGR